MACVPLISKAHVRFIFIGVGSAENSIIRQPVYPHQLTAIIGAYQPIRVNNDSYYIDELTNFV